MPRGSVLPRSDSRHQQHKMRIVVVNGAVANVDRAAGEQWSDLIVQDRAGALLAASPHDLVDDDVFVIDAERVYETQEVEHLKSVHDQIVERVAVGGCIICL